MNSTREHSAGSAQLFLRDEDLRHAQDLMLLAYRDLTRTADPVLATHGFSRAHHRALHFIARNPGLTVGDLLALLGITKQSLARVLGPLVSGGFVAQTAGRVDRRQRLLTLAPNGIELERQLYEQHRQRLAQAYRAAGGQAVEGFRLVMRALLDDPARSYVDRRRK